MSDIEPRDKPRARRGAPRSGKPTLRTIAEMTGLAVTTISRALNNAPANIIAPFQYFQLLGSVVVGYLFFGDFPDFLGWIGAAIIVGGGLYIGWSQTRKT